MNRKNSHRRYKEESGFALLVTIIIVGVVVSIGLSILDLSIKQVNLSTNIKDSELAFHAANAGMECAYYWRQKKATEMETGQNIDPSCFGIVLLNISADSSRVTNNGHADDKVHVYEFEFSWGGSGAGDRCTKVTTVIANATNNNVNADMDDLKDFVPGYPSEDVYWGCPVGGRCTIMLSQGYNKPCSDIGSYGTLQREVLLQSG